MNVSRELIILFSRAPILGRVKQRLAIDIGNESALRVHEKLFSRTCDLIAETGIASTIYLSESPINDFQYRYHLQVGNNLGNRMAAAVKAELEQNEKICLIGSDCLDLQATDLTDALINLEINDLVIGPARDGGYYLIAMKNFYPALFRNISWGTEAVLEETLAIAHRMKLKTLLLEKRQDVDRISDLPTNWKSI